MPEQAAGDPGFRRGDERQNGSLKPGGSGRPLVILPISSLLTRSALSRASLKAAASRSSSICFSAGTIRLSSIAIALMRPFPAARLLTRPPPATPPPPPPSRLPRPPPPPARPPPPPPLPP